MNLSKNKIFIKVFKTMFLAILFLTTLFTFYSISTQKDEILKSLALEAQSIAKMIIYVSSDAIVLNDGSYIVEFNHELLSEHDLLESIIISGSDNKYYQIKKDGWTFEENIDKVFKEEEKNYASLKIMYSPILEKEIFHYSYPIVFSGTRWGYLHLSLSLTEYNSKINKMYFDFFSFFILLLLITILISYIIANNFAKPIVNLNKIANRIAKGNLGLRSSYESDDEIGELANSFNQMISKIETSQRALTESHEQLEERVKNRTLELYEANKELEDLNKNLDLRVKKEVLQRSKQEGLLIQQSRLAAMGEMIGNIAHQWRQPLSVITTAASGIKVEKEVGISKQEDEMKKLDTIVKTSYYLSHTIEDFSNFFKPNKNKENFLIRDKIEQSLELVDSSLKFHYIDVIKNFEGESCVYGYPNECAQAMMNILSNAKDILIERKIQNPVIRVRVYRDNDSGVLEIEDNAGGVSNEIIEKIFDPYFTTKHKRQGTGIGLYMSKVIIEQNMAGVLEVHNGEYGAIFKIVLPINK